MTTMQRVGIPALMKPTPVPIEPSPPGEFRIINSGTWADPLTGNPHASMDKPCALADLSDGRRVARKTLPGQHGNPILVYWLIDHPGKGPVALNSSKDELHDLHEALDRFRSNPRNGTGLIAKTPIELEAERFCKEYPHIGYKLGLTDVKAARAFDVGEVWRTGVYDRAVAGDLDFRAYLDRHGAGDFGVNGRLGDVPPLTEEQVWTIGLQSQAIRNAEAIRSKLGVVRSEYRETGPSGRAFSVLVETGLMRDPRHTVTWIRVLTPG
jgi:hypothetical protein